jgi:demethoxyubiquinone hydroxylase (CLK1/Coq7/Cat5 family)
MLTLVPKARFASRTILTNARAFSAAQDPRVKTTKS